MTTRERAAQMEADDAAERAEWIRIRARLARSARRRAGPDLLSGDEPSNRPWLSLFIPPDPDGDISLPGDGA